MAGTLGEVKLVAWCNVRKYQGVLSRIKGLDEGQQEWFLESFLW